MLFPADRIYTKSTTTHSEKKKDAMGKKTKNAKKVAKGGARLVGGVILTGPLIVYALGAGVFKAASFLARQAHITGQMGNVREMSNLLVALRGIVEEILKNSDDYKPEDDEDAKLDVKYYEAYIKFLDILGFANVENAVENNKFDKEKLDSEVKVELINFAKKKFAKGSNLEALAFKKAKSDKKPKTVFEALISKIGKPSDLTIERRDAAKFLKKLGSKKGETKKIETYNNAKEELEKAVVKLAAHRSYMQSFGKGVARRAKSFVKFVKGSKPDAKKDNSHKQMTDQYARGRDFFKSFSDITIPVTENTVYMYQSASSEGQSKMLSSKGKAILRSVQDINMSNQMRAAKKNHTKMVNQLQRQIEAKIKSGSGG